MLITIDTDKLINYDLTLDEVLLLIAIKNGITINDNTYSNCHNKDLLFKEFNKNTNKFFFTLNKAGEDLIEEFLTDCEIVIDKKKNIKDIRFENLANKLRELYPSGKKEGTNYYWKDSTRVIANKLKALSKNYGDFTDEEAIEATKKYIESFNGNYTYMQLLKYFISKREFKCGELVDNSQLMSYIQNKDQDNYNSNWSSELR
mgnify:FL=1|jgi:hypothetical protein